jgi:hypothetical protein
LRLGGSEGKILAPVYYVGLRSGDGKWLLREIGRGAFSSGRKFPWAVGIADAHGVLRLRSAAPRFAQDDSGEMLAEVLVEVLAEVLVVVFD